MTFVFDFNSRWELPKARTSRLVRRCKLLDGFRAEANELDVQMKAGRQTCRHIAVDHDYSGLNLSNNIDNRGKEVDHLTSRIRHMDRGSVFNGFASVFKARRLDEREGKGRAVLLASEVVFNCLHQGQTVDLVIGGSCRNIILETRRSSKMDFNSDVCIAERLGGSEEDVELARLNVGDE